MKTLDSFLFRKKDKDFYSHFWPLPDTLVFNILKQGMISGPVAEN